MDHTRDARRCRMWGPCSRTSISSCTIGAEVSGLITMVVNDDGMGNALTVECNDDNNTDTVEVVECTPPG